MAVVKELFSAYNNGELPAQGGFIISAFFDANSTYTKYEVTAYNAVKDIYPSEEGLTFQAEGRKIFVLVEPNNYPSKHIEPAYRDAFHKIPYRYKELDTYTSRRQDRIMIGKEPVITYTSFTILKSQGHNFSYIFFQTDDLLDVVHEFFEKSIWRDAGVPRVDAKNVTKTIVENFKRIVIQPGDQMPE